MAETGQRLGAREIANGSEPRLGELLQAEGLLGPGELEQVADEQARSGARFGEAAVSLGLISQDELMRALSRRYDYAYLPAGHSKLHPSLLALFDPFATGCEALRSLRSQLLIDVFGQGRTTRSLALVSPGHGEGRSYVAANLAVLFSQMGERTLLIDADLRKPALHQLFSLDNRYGLSNLLAGHCALNDAIDVIPELPNLTVLKGGAVPPNPLELLSRGRLRELIELVRKHFDVILIDTTAAGEGSDAIRVAHAAGLAVVLARAGQTGARPLASLVSQLRQARVELAGCVMNR
ncbi:polysaccharide biosynthesis tyrosine autokinase [Crenobacter intestini]|uniref:Polysaccharide biosynthesis tyrosine autokinase n=1 Tax=Crenobacter intestini TaxID=2563443 RepID=A0A4T0V193_9NEIS|nr:polysaccharide biosynthesis tyrosine autokinase [Crenobacter intestini]TIC85322.1 polysaccharide biosynthesis tyrosine autokinase [Crenobacter intestini]